MTSEQVAEAVVAWAVEELPALQGSYDHPEPDRLYPLPDVMAAVTGIRILDAAPAGLPTIGQIEQTLARVRDLRVIFAVDPTDPDEASAQVEGFADTLTDSLLADHTLGGRVPGASPTVTWSFEPPFIEFDDGTKARQATLTLVVAEPVPARVPVPA